MAGEITPTFWADDEGRRWIGRQLHWEQTLERLRRTPTPEPSPDELDVNEAA